MTDLPTAADFENLPQQRIAAHCGDTQVALEVIEVRRLTPHAHAPAPFAVTLRDTGAQQSLPQGPFRYEFPERGALELFTVPLGPDGKGMCYEITFN
jgi:hypothetical protein